MSMSVSESCPGQLKNLMRYIPHNVEKQSKIWPRTGIFAKKSQKTKNDFPMFLIFRSLDFFSPIFRLNSCGWHAFFKMENWMHSVLALHWLLLQQYTTMINLFIRALFFSFFFYWTRVRSLAMLVTHSLTHSRLANLIDLTLTCQDGNSKLVEVDTVVDVDEKQFISVRG